MYFAKLIFLSLPMNVLSQFIFFFAEKDSSVFMYVFGVYIQEKLLRPIVLSLESSIVPLFINYTE